MFFLFNLFFTFAAKLFFNFFMELLSQTEENYLKAIYNLSDGLRKFVSTNAIASYLDTKASSVTDMLKRLSEKLFLDYQKYQGVLLSEKGKKQAVKIIRKHRLWEVFMVKHLNFNWEEVHEVAEQLEHIQSQKLIEELDVFLGFPTHDPHGDPIPDAKGNITSPYNFSLSDVEKNEKVILVGTRDSSVSFLKYLNKIHLNLGVGVEILEREPFDKSLHVKINNDKNQYLSDKIAKNLLVKKQENPRRK